jgi:trehalose 6-phosphate synthase/phosphatase
MTTYEELKGFFAKQNLKVIMAADAETVVLKREGKSIAEFLPSGGVSSVMDPIAKAASAVYIARAKNPEEKKSPEQTIEDEKGKYKLKRLFFEQKDLDGYYNGYSNQTLWPLSHVAFELPIFNPQWYESFKKVNEKFAEKIKEEIKGNTFVWVNDYQLSLVPKFVGRPKNTTIGLFWHIPWPTWEAFRILPQKKEILESLLTCDFIGFHRGYHVRNFLDTVRREFELRIDEETNKVYFQGHATTVKNLPLGIDTDVIAAIAKKEEEKRINVPKIIVRKLFKVDENKEQTEEKEDLFDDLFKEYKVILGVDRMDYTKGLKLRLDGIERFFEMNKKYLGKVVYLGIMAPSREQIPAYKAVKNEVETETDRINAKFGKNGWRPIRLAYKVFDRGEIIKLYMKSDLCLVTPRDDGMNLVSKEYVAAASVGKKPGMIILSQFAGSAIDLTSALIINPYDLNEIAESIKTGLEMNEREKIRRMRSMAKTLDDRNVYEWALEFFEGALDAKSSKQVGL